MNKAADGHGGSLLLPKRPAAYFQNWRVVGTWKDVLQQLWTDSSFASANLEPPPQQI
jgi:hypothetical protein